MMAYWLDRYFLEWNLMFGKAAVNTIVTLLVVFSGIAIGCVAGSKCYRNSD